MYIVYRRMVGRIRDFREFKSLHSISIWEKIIFWPGYLLAVQDSSIGDLVSQSVSHLLISEPREHQIVTLDTSRH